MPNETLIQIGEPILFLTHPSSRSSWNITLLSSSTLLLCCASMVRCAVCDVWRGARLMCGATHGWCHPASTKVCNPLFVWVCLVQLDPLNGKAYKLQPACDHCKSVRGHSYCLYWNDLICLCYTNQFGSNLFASSLYTPHHWIELEVTYWFKLKANTNTAIHYKSHYKSIN